MEVLRKEPTFEETLHVEPMEKGWLETPASIIIQLPITIAELAEHLNKRPFHLIALLIQKKCFVTAEKTLELETVQWVADHYGVEVLVTNA